MKPQKILYRLAIKRCLSDGKNVVKELKQNWPVLSGPPVRYYARLPNTDFSILSIAAHFILYFRCHRIQRLMMKLFIAEREFCGYSEAIKLFVMNHKKVYREMRRFATFPIDDVNLNGVIRY